MKKLDILIIKKPHLSEKTTALRSQNQYVFEVDINANKNTVKKAVEDYYHVKVLKVRIMKTPAKIKNWKRIASTGQDKKKAIVTLAPGQKIELGV